MAWASKKQYAICMESEEGKDLIEKLPQMEQDEFNVEFGKLLGKSGASYDSKNDSDYEENDESKSNASNDVDEQYKDYSSIKNDKHRLNTIIGDVSRMSKNKFYDVLDFRKTLEKNGFAVDEIENKSGTWKDHNGEKYKEYDIKLKDGQHIYFQLIADEDYNTKEVIAYPNGKGW